MSAQIPLSLRWPSWLRLEQFDASGASQGTTAALEAAARDAQAPWVFVSGPGGSGKTHLLVGTCHAAQTCGRRAQYLDIGELAAPRAERLRALGGSDLLALDGVDALAGTPADEHALFDLYNRCRAEGSVLVFAAAAPPALLPLGLPDLRSRLAACVQGRLKPLDEGARRALLQARAAARGIELDEAVLDWLFAHQARDLGTLTGLLERIDRAALAAQRRVTIPFLRQLLAAPR
ncbi:MAG TPA: DnaA regulatory inactivator Hda [Dokdonella sp.]|uniref:DnaA regulatory inactivator Hda n=1 Tax=Dokdonella sp. TaxID=2291710 RepID=UPI002C4D346F|nr:DnaA regulatory inactivator Hda [Dokdonella sp.]HUD40449.1 DnaA regulatory inactivator Hda [Dokdonella sp.]